MKSVKYYASIALILCLMFFVSCNEEVEEPQPPIHPVVGINFDILEPILYDEMVYIKGGEFKLGQTNKVELSDYYIGRYEVTQHFWDYVIGYNGICADGSTMSAYTSDVWLNNKPSSKYGIGNYYPVYFVSWNDIVNVFIPRLNKITGKKFRLPTEAEWEYAARGGESSVGYKFSGGDMIDSVAWYAKNAPTAHQIGFKLPNELGIYDMTGNVSEWCSDWYGEHELSTKTNPTGPKSGEYKVFRGGSWGNTALDCEVLVRSCSAPDMSYCSLGFRLAYADEAQVAPDDITPDVFSGDPKGYMDRVLAECYQSLASSGYNGPVNTVASGSKAFIRAVFVCNELTTDEFAWKQFGDAGYYELTTMQFAADNGLMYTTYSRLYTCIALCNEFIRTVTKGKPILKDELISIAEEYIRQVKVLRGLCYFYAIDMFGNAGYSDETMPAGTTPAQMERADLYKEVVAGLEEVSASWGETYSTPSYGYVGKEACDALLAKFYLNAEVFSGVPAYDKCWAICDKIIKHHKGAGFNGSGLADSYIALFGANNDEYMAEGTRVNEIIWGIPQDGDYLQNYGGTTFYIAAASSTSTPGLNMTNASTGLNASWTCMNARTQLSKRFEWDDAGNSIDARASLWMTSKDGANIENTSITNFADGYVPVKYTNYAYDEFGGIDASKNPPASNAFANADWCVIRLAEIYLSAAEAAVLGGVGDRNAALEYVNYIRERAWIEPMGMAQLTPDNILDERSRELYGENCRRTDLVRHNKYAGGNYNWNWKGNVADGGTATPQHMDIFPIPSAVISFQGFKQNPGY